MLVDRAGASWAFRSVAEHTQPGDRVFGVDRTLYCLCDRRWTIFEAYEPNPEMHEEARKAIPYAQAALFFTIQTNNPQSLPMTAEIVKKKGAWLSGAHHWLIYRAGEG